MSISPGDGLGYVGDRLRFEKSSPRWRIVEREEIEEMEEMEEDSTEIERQRNKERRMEQAICAPGRYPSRPACTRRSGRPAPVDRLKWPCSRVGAVDRAGRPWHGSVDRPVDQQTRLEFPFRIRIPFLDGIESNLGFYKSRDSVAINRG